MESVFTGGETAPLHGALTGPVKGRLNDQLRGIDYLRVRPDGRRALELRGTIETDDGSRIAFSAESVGSPRNGEPIVDLTVEIDLMTAAAAYSWVNAKPAWGRGYADFAANKIPVEVYLRASTQRPDPRRVVAGRNATMSRVQRRPICGRFASPRPWRGSAHGRVTNMRILVLGATGGTGRVVVDQAPTRGHAKALQPRISETLIDQASRYAARLNEPSPSRN